MTAEVAIINSNAVAIAADSAVTIGRGKKIYNSAIKVFALSKISPVAIMVYGNAGLLGVPWETIIKIYRSSLKNRQFGALEAHANHFLTFLRNQKQLFTTELQASWVEGSVRGYFTYIRKDFFELVQSEVKTHGKVSDGKSQELFNKCVEDQKKQLEKLPYIKGMLRSDEASVIKTHRKPIRKIMGEIFEGLNLDRAVVTKLNQIASFIHTREIFSESTSGVVISGFGSNDIYPVVCTYEVEGVLGNKLKYRFRDDKSHRIKDGNDCSIIPFAQDDMVALFMEGINPAVANFIVTYISQLFDRLPELIDDSKLSGSKKVKKSTKDKLKSDSDKLLKGFLAQLQVHKHSEHIGPVLDMVQVLPKDELAAMAEALVNLTAFKRRMTDELETVGGPIDVAVISKGDGLVWVKRKHYFPSDLNQHFFANYFRGVNNGK